MPATPCDSGMSWDWEKCACGMPVCTMPATGCASGSFWDTEKCACMTSTTHDYIVIELNPDKRDMDVHMGQRFSPSESGP